MKRRSAVEPVIGHMKHDNRMERNFLKGKEGDRINAILAGAGYNMRKLLAAIANFFFRLFSRLFHQGFLATFEPAA
jgi:transposase, IS5 family